MPLFIHLLIHASLALLVGWLAGLYFGRPALMILVALLTGFFIDLDHLLEYLFFFQAFNLNDFLNSQHLLESGQAFLYFHGWEFVFLLFVLALIFYRRQLIKAILITAALSLFVHLVSDCFINQLPPRFYSIIYRAKHNFLIEKMLPGKEGLIIKEQKIERY